MRPPRFAAILAAYIERGESPPDECRETIEAWAQMLARIEAAKVLIRPKSIRREAIDAHPEPFRAIVEREVIWLYNKRKQAHEKRSSETADTYGDTRSNVGLAAR